MMMVALDDDDEHTKKYPKEDLINNSVCVFVFFFCLAGKELMSTPWGVQSMFRTLTSCSFFWSFLGGFDLNGRCLLLMLMMVVFAYSHHRSCLDANRSELSGDFSCSHSLLFFSFFFFAQALMRCITKCDKVLCGVAV